MANKIKTLEEKIHEAADAGRITFTPTDNIDDYEIIARDFLKKIFNLDYDECFISDESALSDFAMCALSEEDPRYDTMTIDNLYKEARFFMVRKIEAEYHITVDPYDYLVKVFDKIRSNIVKSPLQ
jgi:hypothetical protein